MSDFADEKLITPQAADKLIAGHDSEVALLYLYLVRSGSDDLEAAAKALCRTLSQVSDAMEKLRRMELDEAPSALLGGVSRTDVTSPVKEAPPVVPEPLDRLPEYEAKDVTRLAASDSGFAAVMNEARLVLNSAFNTAAQKTLVGIYSHLGMPAEVIMELLHFCASVCDTPGSRRRLTMRFIEKEAYVWARNEIFTLEQAEAYIEARHSLNAAVSQIKEAMGIRGRELTETERKYITSWLDMGYGEKEISEAYDRTITNTGTLRWNYMNKIIVSWNENGLKNINDIREKDNRRNAHSTPRRKSGSRDTPVDMDELNRFLEKM